MSPHWDTGSAPKDVAARPTLVLAYARTPSLGVVLRLPGAHPEEGSAVVGAHWMASIGATVREFHLKRESRHPPTRHSTPARGYSSRQVATGRWSLESWLQLPVVHRDGNYFHWLCVVEATSSTLNALA